MLNGKGRYKLRIIVVEDEQRICKSIVNKITACLPDCEVAATATNGEEALQMIAEHHPDIVMTDIKMPVMDGLELSRLIKEKYPSLYIVILSGFSNFAFAQQAIQYGVFNYLLKPLSENKLVETLEEIRTKIEEVENRKANKAWLSKTIQTNVQEMGLLSDQEDYFVFSLNFFNICYDSNDDGLLNHYVKLLAHIDWELVLRDLNDYKWFVVDDYVCNKKNIIFSLNRGLSTEADRLVYTVMNNFSKYYGNLCLNLCYHRQRIERDDIWLYSKRLRHVLDNLIVPAIPQVYQLEKHETVESDSLYDIACMQIKKVAKPYVRQFKYAELKKEFMDIFDYMLSMQAPQRQLYKMAAHIFKFLEYSFEIDIENLKQNFSRKISISQSIDPIRDSFKTILDECLQQGHEDENTDDKVKQEILKYINENYVTINSMEEVANAFNYNYTYLSRMFKNMTGTNLVKYITNKRIEAARQIMSDHPEIGVNLVGEKVGYTDQHYFSRIFKSVTGMSPREYKSFLK